MAGNDIVGFCWSAENKSHFLLASRKQKSYPAGQQKTKVISRWLAENKSHLLLASKKQKSYPAGQRKAKFISRWSAGNKSHFPLASEKTKNCIPLASGGHGLHVEDRWGTRVWVTVRV